MVIISAFQAEDDGSIPFTRSHRKRGSREPCFLFPLSGVELTRQVIEKMLLYFVQENSEP